MKIVKTDDCLHTLQRFPDSIQKLYKTQENYLKNNWRDTRLHIKKVRDMPRVFTFRITRRYRAFFYFQNPETIIIFTVDHRKDAYR